MLLSRALLAFAVLGGVAYGATTDGATVDETADRGLRFSDDSCDMDLVTALSVRHPDVDQFVVMATDSFTATTGTVEIAARNRNGPWRCQRSAMRARFGSNGTRPLIDRRSGDDTTPAGVFPLGLVTAWDGDQFSIFGNQPDPGALAPYRDVQPQDCWGATKNTARYQHLVNLPNCTGPDEWLPRYGDVYSHAAVIGANLDPVSGDAQGEIPYAAAIFLHRHSYNGGVTRPTSGCVSLNYDDLVTTIRLIDPRLAPHFAIGPREWLRDS